VSGETAEAKVERLITEIEDAGTKLAAIEVERERLRAEIVHMLAELAATVHGVE
jgi:outer membrane murein-binding lipoprotein Lpp